MATKYTRRSVLAGGIILAGATQLGSRAIAEAAEGAQGVGGGAADPKTGKAGDNSFKTRIASCNCGQLRVTIVGPDPERISLCPCKLCQRQSGSAFAIQARFPKEQVTIEGDSTSWRFPVEGADPVDFPNCAEAGADFHFCPVCGSTVYYTSDIDDARVGIKIGAFADPDFPPPKITGYTEYSHPWTMNLEELSLEVVQGKQH